MSAKFILNSDYYYKPTWVWRLPAGVTCPGAWQCQARFNVQTGRIERGPGNIFTCYAAIAERYPAVRSRAWQNYCSVRGRITQEAQKQLLTALPAEAEYVRIHEGGDFFTQAYFDAWLILACQRSLTTFWAFTKSIPFWIARLGQIPQNLTLTASVGGVYDHLIQEHGLKSATVVHSITEARLLGLCIDTDDRLAMSGTESFALLENYGK